MKGVLARLKSRPTYVVVVVIAAVVRSAGLQSRDALDQTPPAPKVYVTAAASALITDGLALPEPAGAEAAAFQVVPAPIVRNVQNEALATSAPWIDSNGWRFQRGLTKANYATLPGGAAPLAAAEAFAFNVDALINAPAADVPDLGNVLRFLKAHTAPPLPTLANVGVIDNGSPYLDEAMNMLTRRNLMFKLVPKGDRSQQVTVEIGSPEFPLASAVNPSDFAARVRAAVGDERRLVRIYGSTSLIARLTGNESRARLVVLNFSRSRNTTNAASPRIRVLGGYKPVALAAFGAPAEAKLEDVRDLAGATEFTLPFFMNIAIVDLESQRR